MTGRRPRTDSHLIRPLTLPEAIVPQALSLDSDDGPIFYVSDVSGHIVYGNQNFRFLAQTILEHHAGDPEAVPFPMPQKSLARITDEVRQQDASVVGEEVFVVGEFVKRFRSVHVGLYDNNGELTGLAALYHDITREHEAANQVAQMHERLHDITRLVSDWVWEGNGTRQASPPYAWVSICHRFSSVDRTFPRS